MDSEQTFTEQTQSLVVAYLKMNDEGREVLDMVIEKLADNKFKTENIKQKGGLLNND